MPGALAVLTARDGRVALTQQGRPRDIGTFPESFVDLTAEERELFTSRVSVHPQDTVFIPDFPRSSQILKQMWEARQPHRLDGVLSVDPVGMSYLLRGTGPVTLDSGLTLTADNAADVLLNEVYRTLTEEEQNAVFDETARKVFDALVTGPVDAPALLDALAQAAGERRLMIWSAREAEQAEIATTAIAGELPVAPGPRPEIGVYLNDSGADKLSYYLDYRVEVAPQVCFAEDRQVIDVRVSLRNTVAPGTELTPSLVGPGLAGLPPGVLRHSVYLYAPVAGRVAEMELDGEEAPSATFTYRGRQVAAVTVDLARTQERVLTYRVHTGPGQPGRARLITTPGPRGLGVGEVGAPAC
jgi:hypothetical protein